MEGRAAASLYVEQRERVLALCMAMLHDRSDAEDAVQETFARITARLDALNGDPVGYLMVVARNVCRDELRRRCRATAVRPDGQREDDVERTAVDRGVLRTVWSGLRAPERRLLAAVASGVSTEEIARARGLSIAAVAQRISRARRRARDMAAAPLLLLLRGGGVPRLLGAGREAEWIAAPLLLAIVAGVLHGGAGTGHATTPQHTQRPAQQQAAALPPVQPAATATRPPSSNGLRFAPPHIEVNGQVLHTAPALDGYRVVSFTPSPDYADDHTVYASTRPEGLWRSADAGHSWQSLGGAGLLQGTVLLPPHFPSDPTLFAVAPGVALLQSTDGGAHFLPALPLAPAMAAIEPDSPPGDARIWLLPQSAPALLVWDQATGGLQPVVGLPPDVDAVSSVFSVPGAPDVYANVVEAVGGTSLWACTTATRCHRAGPATGQIPVAALGAGGEPVFFLLHPNGVDVRSASGTERARIDAEPGTAIEFVLPGADFTHTGRFDVVARGRLASTPLLSVLHLLRDTIPGGARPWSPPAGTVLLSRLPDGRLLSALGPLTVGSQATGLLCSADDGATWAPAC